MFLTGGAGYCTNPKPSLINMLNPRAHRIFTGGLIGPVGVSCPDRAKVANREPDFAYRCVIPVCIGQRLFELLEWGWIIIAGFGDKSERKKQRNRNGKTDGLSHRDEGFRVQERRGLSEDREYNAAPSALNARSMYSPFCGKSRCFFVASWSEARASARLPHSIGACPEDSHLAGRSRSYAWARYANVL